MDPGNKEALSLFHKGDVIGFATASHPLVSVILHGLVEYKMKSLNADDLL